MGRHKNTRHILGNSTELRFLSGNPLEFLLALPSQMVSSRGVESSRARSLDISGTSSAKTGSAAQPGIRRNWRRNSKPSILGIEKYPKAPLRIRYRPRDAKGLHRWMLQLAEDVPAFSVLPSHRTALLPVVRRLEIFSWPTRALCVRSRITGVKSYCEISMAHFQLARTCMRDISESGTYPRPSYDQPDGLYSQNEVLRDIRLSTGFACNS